MIYVNIIDPIVSLFSPEIQETLTKLSIWSILLRLFLTLLLAGAIGLERQVKRHTAGFRTYILMCLASSTGMMVNQFIIETFSLSDTGIGGMVILGVAILGSGTMLVTSRNRIKGLTTAAGLWASAVMGLAIGAGAYTLSLGACIIILICLSILPHVEEWMLSRAEFFDIHIEFLDRSKMKDFIDFCREVGLKVTSVEHNPAYLNSGLFVYTIALTLPKTSKFKNHKEFIETVKTFEYIHYVEEIY